MRITKLDGLRGIFCLMIILFHYKEDFLPSYLYNNFFIRESYLAVDFFFVLSGFVISYNYNTIKTIGEFITYIKKRFIRLYPLLLFSTTAFFLTDLFFNYFLPTYISTVEPFYALFKKYLDTIAFTNSTPILGNTFGMNPPSWSISAEMISYIIFGFSMVFIPKKYTRPFLMTIIILSAVFLIINGWLFEIKGDLSFLRGFISFNIGYFVWLFSLKKFKINNSLEFILPILFLFLLFISFNVTGLSKNIVSYAIIPLYFGFSVLTFLKTDGVLSKLLESKPLKFLGDISYSIYLNHFIILILVPEGIVTFLGLSKTNFHLILIFIISVTLIILYSFFTYKVVESRGASYLKKKLL
ncbi:acyltransferase family protein [Draconibacterium mangrovi]|uniref:acyltransferase family protein n=1 Tax=Draconibacterium mangrovi TaxID=2697469 RepID=UPI0013D0EC0A|nr:acyltransferase [Draconibacterium mangrovi]